MFQKCTSSTNRGRYNTRIILAILNNFYICYIANWLYFSKIYNGLFSCFITVLLSYFKTEVYLVDLWCLCHYNYITEIENNKFSLHVLKFRSVNPFCKKALVTGKKFWSVYFHFRSTAKYNIHAGDFCIFLVMYIGGLW